MTGRPARIGYRVVRQVDPAAGAGFTLTPTPGRLWVLRSLVFRLVTDATVANRHPRIEISDQTTVYMQTSTRNDQAASLTRDYAAFAGADTIVDNGITRLIPLDALGQYIGAGHVITIAVENLQPADQISRIGALVLEYDTGPTAHAEPVAPVWVPEFDSTYVS